MWDILEWSRVFFAGFAARSDEDRGSLGDDSITRLQFHGFDLNHQAEGRLLGYRPLGRVRDVP